ncbi:hypothetical protein [Granulicella pectinivorans]|nr:hypothetical protein [Granulicella pectinivorans]
MLLAEIHGKRLPEVETQEDWLTSAVFGHLRHIPPSLFWQELFERAKNVGPQQSSLASQLFHEGIALSSFMNLEMKFWPNSQRYGEPDLILRFTGPSICPLIVLFEMKLNSTKSGVGKNDQLVKYLQLLDDKAALHEWTCAKDHRFVVYLTRIFAHQEIEDSVRMSGDSSSAERFFGLEWRDILETADSEANGNELLKELASFLKGRGFESFKGLRTPSLPVNWAGLSFYTSDYFVPLEAFGWPAGEPVGRFYGE